MAQMRCTGVNPETGRICNKRLADIDEIGPGARIEIKCPRCKRLNVLEGEAPGRAPAKSN